MCEVESSVVNGTGDMTPPVGLLNDSEGVPEVARAEEVLLTKCSEEEGKPVLENSSEGGEEEKPQENIQPPKEVPSEENIQPPKEVPSEENIQPPKEVPSEENIQPPKDSPSDEVAEVKIISVGTQDPFGGDSRISQVYILSDLAETEGVDPFKPIEKGDVTNGDLQKDSDPEGTTLLREPSFKDERRDSKTVSFREPEKEEEEDIGETDVEVKDHLMLNSTSSNGSQEGDGAVEKKKHQRALGENNPVYRLSMKLSPNLFNIQEIPGATQHREVEKAGYLTKLSGRSFPYIAQWKRRYCVLSKGRLYYYEREDSKSGEKSNGVINLEYFDQVAEAAPKDCKKATNVFVITSQDRSFFDPGRHLFSADTLPDMKDWVRKLQSALEQTRNNNRPTTTTTTTTATSAASPSIKKDSGKKPKEQATIQETNSLNNTKERKKKKESSHRSRKSSKIADVSDGNPESAELPAMTSPIGIQLPGMTSVPRGGVALPGLSPTRKEAPQEDAARETTISESNLRTDDGLPVAGPTLACVTKQRNKGPQGRRAPQNRRNNGDSALKKRASSLSALEHQELNDNRSESSQGTRDSDRLSKTTENDLEAVKEEEDSSKNESFDDIDKDLFFKKSITDIVASESETTGHDKRGGEGDGKATKEAKHSAPAKEAARNKENVSRSRSRNSSLFGNRLSRFRETMMTFKSNRYQSKEAASAGHPDETVERSRWGCSIL